MRPLKAIAALLLVAFTLNAASAQSKHHHKKHHKHHHKMHNKTSTGNDNKM